MKIRNITTRNKHYGDSIRTESDSILDALNDASQAWFGGTPVVDHAVGAIDPSGFQATLLSSSSNGNVIGRVFVFT